MNKHTDHAIRWIAACVSERVFLGQRTGDWKHLTSDAVEELVRRALADAKRFRKADKARKGKA